jgi:hypothetical protein
MTSAQLPYLAAQHSFYLQTPEPWLQPSYLPDKLAATSGMATASMCLVKCSTSTMTYLLLGDHDILIAS